MFKFTFRILKLTIIVIIVLIGGFWGFYSIKNSIDDSKTLKKVQEQLIWAENFYTINARYPSQTEFTNQFPNSQSSYGTYNADMDKNNPAYSFFLSYKLLKERVDAIGVPVTGVFGYEGHYNVWPCRRWDGFDLAPGNWNFVSSPDGVIHSDFYAGKIYFSHDEQPNEKIPLLSGLNNPRLFLKNNNDRTNNIFVSNGNDIISYEWVGSELKLKNPQKIGVVPTTHCPVSSYR